MPHVDPNYARHLQYEAAKRAKRKPTREEDRIARYNKHAIQEITRLTEKRRAMKVKEAEEKQETLIAAAADHFIKRTADNQEDAYKKMGEIIKYHGA